MVGVGSSEIRAVADATGKRRAALLSVAALLPQPARSALVVSTGGSVEPDRCCESDGHHHAEADRGAVCAQEVPAVDLVEADHGLPANAARYPMPAAPATSLD
jgi:hypothetical protein